MLPVAAHAAISASREEIYDTIADLALRPAWCDHFQKDFRLAHPRSTGKGAAARYLVDAPLSSLWMEVTVVEADSPRRLVERAHGGRNGRTKGGVTWELTRAGQGLTRVEMTTWTEAGTARERFKERLGMRSWMTRQSRTALERLRLIFEEGIDEPLARATVAGFEPLTAPRFGESPRVVRG
jgi:polyketide cyclase/dehydrase/lipid transport protein